MFQIWKYSPVVNVWWRHQHCQRRPWCGAPSETQWQTCTGLKDFVLQLSTSIGVLLATFPTFKGFSWPGPGSTPLLSSSGPRADPWLRWQNLTNSLEKVSNSLETVSTAHCSLSRCKSVWLRFETCLTWAECGVRGARAEAGARESQRWVKRK